MKVTEFRNKEIAFLTSNTLNTNKIQFPKRGYKLVYSNYLEKLKKTVHINNKKYNSYVTIATYSEMPLFPFEPKEHYKQFHEWAKIRDQTIKNIDFILDFDSTPTIKGITAAWQDVKKSIPLLQLLIGQQVKNLTIWFSGNKGFHILAKCKITTTAQEIINTQKALALELSLLCPTIDTTIYDTARLRKLLGSKVYSKNFGTTRVIPIQNENDFKDLIQALKNKNTKYFEKKEITQLNNLQL